MHVEQWRSHCRTERTEPRYASALYPLRRARRRRSRRCSSKAQSGPKRSPVTRILPLSMSVGIGLVAPVVDLHADMHGCEASPTQWLQMPMSWMVSLSRGGGLRRPDEGRKIIRQALESGSLLARAFAISAPLQKPGRPPIMWRASAPLTTPRCGEWPCWPRQLRSQSREKSVLGSHSVANHPIGAHVASRLSQRCILGTTAMLVLGLLAGYAGPAARAP
jgi:hypothetical protein